MTLPMPLIKVIDLKFNNMFFSLSHVNSYDYGSTFSLVSMTTSFVIASLVLSKVKYTCRALEALAYERNSTFEEQRRLYEDSLHLGAWHKITSCFKRTTAPKECPLSFKQFIESK